MIRLGHNSFLILSCEQLGTHVKKRQVKTHVQTAHELRDLKWIFFHLSMASNSCVGGGGGGGGGGGRKKLNKKALKMTIDWSFSEFFCFFCFVFFRAFFFFFFFNITRKTVN